MWWKWAQRQRWGVGVMGHVRRCLPPLILRGRFREVSASRHVVAPDLLLSPGMSATPSVLRDSVMAMLRDVTSASPPSALTLASTMSSICDMAEGLVVSRVGDPRHAGELALLRELRDAWWSFTRVTEDAMIKYAHSRCMDAVTPHLSELPSSGTRLAFRRVARAYAVKMARDPFVYPEEAVVQVLHIDDTREFYLIRRTTERPELLRRSDCILPGVDLTEPPRIARKSRCMEGSAKGASVGAAKNRIRPRGLMPKRQLAWVEEK